MWQDTAYIIMWKSPKSGGTYTELRRTDWGRDRLLRTLAFLGVDQKDIVVYEQKKVWAPDRVTRAVEKKRVRDPQVRRVTEDVLVGAIDDGENKTRLLS